MVDSLGFGDSEWVLFEIRECYGITIGRDNVGMYQRCLHLIYLYLS